MQRIAPQQQQVAKAMAIKIYAFPPSPRSFKVLWAAHQLGIEYDMRLVDLTKGAQKAPEYAALNPNTRAPSLEDGSFVLWESNAIVEYLCALKPDSGLLPEDTRGRLAITKWMYWESAHWDQACTVFAFERVVKKFFNMGDPDEREIARGHQLFERAGKVLNSELQKHRYVAGDKFTAADLSVGADMSIAEPAQFPIEQLPAVKRWYDEIRALPSWQKTAAKRQTPAGRS
jgi:glutathione S-transferase